VGIHSRSFGPVTAHAGRLGLLLGVLLWPMGATAAEPGPVVAVREFTGAPGYPQIGPGTTTMLITDLVNVQDPCELTIAAWGKDREAVLAEHELQQSGAVDEATRLTPGKLVQPDVFVDGSVSVAGGRFSWSVTISDAMTGEVLGTVQSSAAGDQFFEGAEALAKLLAAELCKARPGFALSGQIDEATVTGLLCGDLSKPFTARSPEVDGTWTFTPADKTRGSFVYVATNVGGAAGKGSGTYTISPATGGTRRVQLSGTGSIVSPIGEFSAPITESLTLTPAASCKRTGNR
jgi:hypothetical protein